MAWVLLMSQLEAPDERDIKSSLIARTQTDTYNGGPLLHFTHSRRIKEGSFDASKTPQQTKCGIFRHTYKHSLWKNTPIACQTVSKRQMVNWQEGGGGGAADMLTLLLLDRKIN